jgi:hypothetical protein
VVGWQGHAFTAADRAQAHSSTNHPPQPAPIFFVDFVEARGVDLFRVACENRREGVIDKLKSGLYDPDAKTWVKVENSLYSAAEGQHEFSNQRRTATA